MNEHGSDLPRDTAELVRLCGPDRELIALAKAFREHNRLQTLRDLRRSWDEQADEEEGVA